MARKNKEASEVEEKQTRSRGRPKKEEVKVTKKHLALFKEGTKIRLKDGSKTKLVPPETIYRAKSPTTGRLVRVKPEDFVVNKKGKLVHKS